MKNSYWAYWIIILGIFVVGVMMLINTTTTTSTQDYYALKEVTQAAMIDAVDYSYFRLYGDIKMSKEKFEENFIRRWAENASLTKTYDISFYDIYEVPPKVSVKVSTKTGNINVANDSNNFDVVNTIDVILLAGTQNAATKTKEVGGQICNMVIQTSLASNIISGSYDSLLSSNLQAWKTKYAGAGKASTSEYAQDFVDAFQADYPNVSSMTGSQLMNDGGLLGKAYENGDITVS